MGLLPHVLHHVGPLAGAALLAGTTGTVMFGLAAFVLTIPLLLRVRRHCGSWRIPVLLLGSFISLWSASTFVVGPWINDQFADRSSAPSRTDRPAEDTEHDQHHDEGDA